MKRMMIKDIKKVIGKKVIIKGFVHDIRNQSKIKFLLLRDVSGIIQCIAMTDSKYFNDIAKLSRESIIELEGFVKKEKQAPGGVEIEIQNICIISKAPSELPISIVEKGNPPALPLRLDFRWLELRKPKNVLIFKIWTTLEKAMREYWLKNNFIQIYSPKFVEGATESGSELFTLDYFGKKASLAQSPQFYKQMAMAAGFEKVFEIGPVFRANPSHTIRHDTEFTSIDVEISFINDVEDIMELEEDWIKFILSKVKKEHGAEIKKVFGVDVVVPKICFPRITMQNVHKILEKEYNYKIKNSDLDPEGERLISDYVQKKFKSDFVFVTEYPVEVRPFYHMRKNKELTKSYDLIWKGLEITTGAQREHRYEILKKQAKEKKVQVSGIKTYLEFFKYGCPPHGGYGLSPSRMLMILLGLKNVREATFLPRDTNRLSP